MRMLTKKEAKEILSLLRNTNYKLKNANSLLDFQDAMRFYKSHSLTKNNDIRFRAKKSMKSKTIGLDEIFPKLLELYDTVSQNMNDTHKKFRTEESRRV